MPKAAVLPRVCGEFGCDRKHHAKGWCRKHYLEHVGDRRRPHLLKRRRSLVPARDGAEYGGEDVPLDVWMARQREALKAGARGRAGFYNADSRGGEG